MKKRRKRTIGSVKSELLEKAREAALSAIQIFNSPQTVFKSETFIVLMVIAWTYMLHAYYRSKGIEYRHYKQGPKNRIFERTRKGGPYRYWELKACLKCDESPIDPDTTNNLLFLIGLRHEIEHQMTRSLDNYLSGRYQACALNFNHYMKDLFGDKYGMDDHLAFSIQFMSLSDEQIIGPKPEEEIPERLRAYITEFDDTLTSEQYNSERYSIRLIFQRKLVNHVGQADKVIEFVNPRSEIVNQDKTYIVKKEVERAKFLAKDIVAKVQEAGFTKFKVYPEHVKMWQEEDARNPVKDYGVKISGNWYWYKSWLRRCLELCENAGDRYR